MALSLAPAAKRALFDALTASTDLAGVGIWHSAPNEDHQGNANVIVGPSDAPVTTSQDWVGLQQREETVDIPVQVTVFTGGTDQFAGEQRAWDIAAVIATVLQARPFDPAIYEAHPADFSQVTEPFADGRLARLTVVVRCNGRLTGI